MEATNLTVRLENLHLVSLLILVILISSNYSVDLLPCNVQKILINSYSLKHISLFLTLLLTVFLNKYDGFKSLKMITFNSILIYVWFILIINMNLYFIGILFLLLLSLIIVLKMIDYENTHLKNKASKQYFDIKVIIEKSILGITLLGVIFSLFNGDFNWRNIFFKDPNCTLYGMS